jgi:hypothetical protein
MFICVLCNSAHANLTINVHLHTRHRATSTRRRERRRRRRRRASPSGWWPVRGARGTTRTSSSMHLMAAQTRWQRGNR